jgi:hypothetical protein
VVELLADYSNRPELLADLTIAQQRLRAMAGKSEVEPRSVRSDAGRPPQQRHVADRLTPAEIACLINSYIGGTPARDHAERYGLGQSAVKRPRRLRGVRRHRDQDMAA